MKDLQTYFKKYIYSGELEYKNGKLDKKFITGVYGSFLANNRELIRNIERYFNECPDRFNIDPFGRDYYGRVQFNPYRMYNRRGMDYASPFKHSVMLYIKIGNELVDKHPIIFFKSPHIRDRKRTNGYSCDINTLSKNSGGSILYPSKTIPIKRGYVSFEPIKWEEREYPKWWDKYYDDIKEMDADLSKKIEISLFSDLLKKVESQKLSKNTKVSEIPKVFYKEEPKKEKNSYSIEKFI